MKNLSNNFLISMPHVSDPIFKQSLIYICNHDNILKDSSELRHHKNNLKLRILDETYCQDEVNDSSFCN